MKTATHMDLPGYGRSHISNWSETHRWSIWLPTSWTGENGGDLMERGKFLTRAEAKAIAEAWMAQRKRPDEGEPEIMESYETFGTSSRTYVWADVRPGAPHRHLFFAHPFFV